MRRAYWVKLSINSSLGASLNRLPVSLAAWVTMCPLSISA